MINGLEAAVNTSKAGFFEFLFVELFGKKTASRCDVAAVFGIDIEVTISQYRGKQYILKSKRMNNEN